MRSGWLRIQRYAPHDKPLSGRRWKISNHYVLAMLAETYGKAVQADEGLMAVSEALARVKTTGEHWCEAELYRLKGELLMKTGTRDKVQEAEAYFHKALEAAHRQQAKSWELRTATSLSRLWQQQKKREEAHQLLAEIYGWFTEGFDTADLQEAKALLIALR
jgi:predicted ATPase